MTPVLLASPTRGLCRLPRVGSSGMASACGRAPCVDVAAEVAVPNGVYAGGLSNDYDKLFDRVDIPILVKTAPAHDY